MLPLIRRSADRAFGRGYAVAIVVAGLAAGPAFSQPTGTPAERAIASAERAVAANARNHEAYTSLALALSRRARETSDSTYYDKAEQALTQSLELAPGNFEARKVRAWVLLGRHEFAAALELAQTLNKQAPDDLLVYGLLTDANTELGRYKEAEAACQWMLDLRPGNIPAVIRAAHLRELFGDLEGAAELMTSAYQRTAPAESEDRAWILTQLAHLALLQGKAADAERLLTEALASFPGYHYALGNLAKVRTAQGRHAEAAELQQRRYEAAPHPENLFELATALEQAGRTADSRAAFDRFEAQALRESAGWDNANRELVFYYADHARKPAEALRIATLEIARRQDVYTLDAHAWALHASGRAKEARDTIERALAVGIRDPAVLARAAAIRGDGRGVAASPPR